MAHVSTAGPATTMAVRTEANGASSNAARGVVCALVPGLAWWSGALWALGRGVGAFVWWVLLGWVLVVAVVLFELGLLAGVRALRSRSALHARIEADAGRPLG